MVRIQSGRPGEGCARARHFRKAREMFFTERARCGVEMVLEVCPRPEETQAEWQVPVAPRSLGWRGFDAVQRKVWAQRGNTEAGVLWVAERSGR